MAELFLAERDSPPRQVVVKRLLPGADDTWRALFAREAEALAAVDSPHVVRLVDHSPQRPDQLVLEYVDGPDLATLLDHLARRGRTLPLPAALAIVHGVLDGLRALHAAGFVHRDVNPSNVVIARATGAVKLVDLGVAGRVASDLPTIAGLKGTLAYMAPEQLRGEPVGPAADLYAAGLLAFEVLTGVPCRPEASGLSELLTARSQLPIPPSQLHPELSADLDAATLALLQPVASARPPTASAALALFPAGGDPEALAAACADVATPVIVTRTLAPEAPRPAPRAAPPRRRPWAAIAVVTAGLVGLALWLALQPPGPEPRPPPQVGETEGGTAAEADSDSDVVASSVDASVVGRSPDAELPLDNPLAAADGVRVEPDGVSGPQPETEPSSDPDVVASGADASVAARSPDGELPLDNPLADADGVGVEPDGVSDLQPASEPEPAPPAAPPKVRIKALGGSIYVSGDAPSGLAPRTTRALDKPRVIKLKSLGVEATLRLTHARGKILAQIGTPGGPWLLVRCAGGDQRSTPVTVAFRRTLSCTLERESGGSMSFRLSRL